MSCSDVDTTLDERIAALERLVRAQGRCLEELVMTLDSVSRTMQMLGQAVTR